MDRKTEQLQIRVSPREKRELQRRARAAGTSLSAWVMHRVLPPKRDELLRILRGLREAHAKSFPLAALSDFLQRLGADEYASVLRDEPSIELEPPYDALVAAMIEHAAARQGAPVPAWVSETPPTATPYFASDLESLRLHLLLASPPAFRRRNLFVDASVGDRR